MSQQDSPLNEITTALEQAIANTHAIVHDDINEEDDWQLAVCEDLVQLAHIAKDTDAALAAYRIICRVIEFEELL